MKKCSLWFVLLLSAACTDDLVYDQQGIQVYVAEDPERYAEVRFTPYDPYELEAAMVSQDSLYLGVRYGGGCGSVRFTLILDQPSQADSDAVISRSAVLMLEDDDDCEAILGAEVPIPLAHLPLGPYSLYVYNPSVNGQVVMVEVP